MAESMREVRRIKVLDKGHVDLIDYMGNDITVVNAARVSFNTRSEYELDIEGFERVQANGNKEHFRCEFLKISKKDEKLIKYLASHNHWTPFVIRKLLLELKHPSVFVLNSLSISKVLWKMKLVVGMFQPSPNFTFLNGEINQKRTQSREVMVLLILVQNLQDHLILRLKNAKMLMIN